MWLIAKNSTARVFRASKLQVATRAKFSFLIGRKKKKSKAKSALLIAQGQSNLQMKVLKKNSAESI